MANTYQDIQALTTGKNNMGLSNTIKRDYGIPLDYSSVQESYEAALEYAKTSTRAYIGQPIAVGDTLYIVTDEAGGYLKAVGTQPKGDNKSIEVSADGTVSIYGFEAAEDATLPRKNQDGSLEWVPISAIVKGDGNTKAVVAAADGSAIKVTENYIAGTDTYTYTLDVTLPPIPEYSISVENAENGTATYKLTKDGEAVGSAIVVPKAYDDSGLASRVTNVEAGITGHETRIASMETFFDSAAVSDEVIDTLKEIQNYISSDESGASDMLKSIQANTAAINTLNGAASIEGSVAKTVADAVSDHDTSVAATYATKAGLTALTEAAATKAALKEVSDDLANNYAKKSDVYTKSEVDTAISGATDDAAQVATDLATHIDNYKSKVAELASADTTNANAIKVNTDAIAAINSSETGILANAKAYADSTAASKVKALEDGKVATNASKIAEVNTALEGKISTINTNISSINGKISALEQADESLQSAINGEKAAREALAKIVNGEEGKPGISAKIATLEAKDIELAGLISGNTEKFKEYYTKTETDTKIASKISENNTSLNALIQANTNAINDEITNRETAVQAVDDKIGGSFTTTDTVAKAIAQNASNISALQTLLNSAIENNDPKALDSIKELAAWVSEHDTEVLPIIEGHTAAINKLNGDVNTTGSVAKTVADAIADIPAATADTLGLVKTSDEVVANSDGVLGIGQVSTDKLVNGSQELVLCGGNANGATILV